MERELNTAWRDTNRHSPSLISDFELRHHCCGYNHIKDMPFPPDKKETPDDRTPEPQCYKNPVYGFKVPCKAELTNGFERWQRRIQQLLFVQLTMLVRIVLNGNTVPHSHIYPKKRARRKVTYIFHSFTFTSSYRSCS